MPRWLLLSILPFLDGDVPTASNLIDAVGFENPYNDDAIVWFLIE